MAQRVNESIEVGAAIDDVFGYWSNFENFPSFMSNVEEVRMAAQDTSHWRVKGPLGKSVEHDAKTTEMNPNRGIGWDTVDGEVMTSGEVRFEEITPGRTQVDVTMNYAEPPALVHRALEPYAPTRISACQHAPCRALVSISALRAQADKRGPQTVAR
jgi:uncharacterized membrane protein